MNEPGEEEVPTCPVCASRRATRAVVLRSDYRCPDCSALFNSDERIVADPRPWVDPRALRGGFVASDMRTGEPRTGASATGSDETRVDERTKPAGTQSPNEPGPTT